MRAMVVSELGQPPAMTDVDDPTLGPGQVLIEVHRSGINFPDLLMIQGLYQARPELPFAPGFEVAGVVRDVSPDVTRFQPGARVAAFVSHGGYAELAAVDHWSVTALPDEVDFDVACGLMAYGTSFYALAERARLAEGETLVVLGASGGVGLAAVELGKTLGASVIAGVGSEWKAEIVSDRGADHVINYSEQPMKERVRELTGGRGADVIYDPVGGDLLQEALRYVNWNGRILVVGFAGGEIPQIPANLLLLKSASAVGVFWGAWTAREPEANQAAMEQLTQWMADSTLRPHVSHTVPLEEANDALALLANRKATGKVVLEVR